MKDNGDNPSEFKVYGDVPSDLSSLLWLLDDDFVPDSTVITDEMVDAFVQELFKLLDGDNTGNKDGPVVLVGSNGSCGPTVSDAASSVMAGIATGPIKKCGPGSSSSSFVVLARNTKVIAELDMVGSPVVAGTVLRLVEGSASTCESCIQGSGGDGSNDQAAKSRINDCDAMEVDE